ncbi:MAG: hypothetical protein U1C18_00440 [Patescibacteria group bacterium]|nr:hypothetical protein [Patescibacteria group bacterium]
MQTDASLYRATLKRAWRTTRTYPHVWVLGFFAALLGNGGEFEFVVTQFNKLSSGDVFFGESLLAMFGTGGSTVISAMADMLRRISDDALLLGAAAFGALAVLWFVVSSQGAIIHAAAQPKAGSLGSHFAAARRSFWQILWILLGTRLLALFVLGVVGMPIAALLLYFTDPVKSLALVSFCLGIPLLMVASVISKYAIAYRMLERRDVRSSVARGISLFADHWLVSVELILTLFVVNVAVGGAVILGILALSAPFLMLAGAFGEGVATNVFLALGQLFGFLLLVVMGSILATFQYASWTELFLRISRERHLSKVVRTIMGWHKKYR